MITSLEAAALDYVDTLDDTALRDGLVDLAHVVAVGYANADELRRLAAHALIVARRFDQHDRAHDDEQLDLAS